MLTGIYKVNHYFRSDMAGNNKNLNVWEAGIEKL